MNFKTAIRQITDDFCNAFYVKYLKGQWGYGAVGYKTVDERIALMRKQLADWQESYDCANELCAKSKMYTCPPGYMLLAPVVLTPSTLSATALSAATVAATFLSASGIPLCGVPGCATCLPIEAEAATTIVSYAQLGNACVLNPPLSAKGKHVWGRHMNTREVIINTFSR